ncbi:hypothetical protein [Fodinibius salsisoli]|uniref:Copper chaperone NosL n=1 Tax=Fodinibius salsisoli TaxID=2820877 RepID=A0ABT3PMZ1_9BACT|nr:hypothetical protein [Fodinibius salsisoli]MCW9707317.1 hypothetical protein [Fodinibius salsisoli]
MKKQSRIWMGAAAIILLGVYLFPIWSISLNAPQYPEGIGLNIWVDTIEGKSPHDLQNINGLNHYIGMKEIQPDSIQELTIMPYLFAGLIITGIVISVFGNRKWVLVWLGAFVLLAITGLVDFYLWEYDYGHNLNPNAAIKIPGMSYQPPLIGTKQLLNMRTTSMPHIGFYFALLSMGLAAWTWWNNGNEKSKVTGTKLNHKLKSVA